MRCSHQCEYVNAIVRRPRDTDMLLELFKNAMRASVEHTRQQNPAVVGLQIPPVEVSVFDTDHEITIKVFLFFTAVFVLVSATQSS